MKKLVWSLVLILSFTGLAIGIAGFFLPAEISVAQNIEINASRAKVFELVNNLSLQESWSPWKELDPTIENTLSGPERGVGAKMTWESSSSGSGSMEITEVVPGHIVQLALDFGAMGKANSSWNFLPAPSGGTKVQWGFTSSPTSNPIARIANLLIKPSLEKTYAKGLENLKAVAEKE